jgi:hypothetical protein
MNSDPPRGSRLTVLVTWLLIYIASGWVVAHFYIHYADTVGSTFEWFPQTNLGAMVDESGQKPFVGRLLVPLIVREMGVLTTPPVQDAERTFWSSARDFTPDFIYGAGARPKNSVEAANIYYLSVLLFILIPLAGRAAYGAVYNDTGFKAGFAGLLLLITIPLWFSITSFFYDPMTVFLSALLIYCAAKGRPWLSIFIFLLALLNKETAVLFIPVLIYGMYAKYTASKLKDDLYYMFLVGLATIAVAVMVQLYRTNHFAANPGDWLEHHWSDTAPILFGKLLLETIHAVLILAVMIAFSFAGFRNKPILLRVATLFVFVPLVIASVAFGRIIEIRAYYDAYPILGLLAMPTLYKLIELTQDNKSLPSGSLNADQSDPGSVESSLNPEPG